MCLGAHYAAIVSALRDELNAQGEAGFVQVVEGAEVGILMQALDKTIASCFQHFVIVNLIIKGKIKQFLAASAPFFGKNVAFLGGKFGVNFGVDKRRPIINLEKQFGDGCGLHCGVFTTQTRQCGIQPSGQFSAPRRGMQFPILFAGQQNVLARLSRLFVALKLCLLGGFLPVEAIQRGCFLAALPIQRHSRVLLAERASIQRP